MSPPWPLRLKMCQSIIELEGLSWALANVVMTPHAAVAGQLRAGRLIARSINNLGRFRRSEPLVDLVNKALSD